MKRSAQQACCNLVLLAIAIVGLDLVPAAAKYGFEIEVRVRTTCRQAPQGDEAPDSKLYGDPSGAKEKLHCFQRNEGFQPKYPVLAESEPGGSPFALHVDHHHELGGGGSKCAVETNYDLHRSIPRGPIMEVVTAPVEVCTGKVVSTRPFNEEEAPQAALSETAIAVKGFLAQLATAVGDGIDPKPLTSIAGMAAATAKTINSEKGWAVYIGGFGDSDKAGFGLPNEPETSLYPQFTFGVPLTKVRAAFHAYSIDSSLIGQAGRASNAMTAKHMQAALEIADKVQAKVEYEQNTLVDGLVIAIANYLAPCAYKNEPLAKNKVGQLIAKTNLMTIIQGLREDEVATEIPAHEEAGILKRALLEVVQERREMESTYESCASVIMKTSEDSASSDEAYIDNLFKLLNPKDALIGGIGEAETGNMGLLNSYSHQINFQSQDESCTRTSGVSDEPMIAFEDRELSLTGSNFRGGVQQKFSADELALVMDQSVQWLQALIGRTDATPLPAATASATVGTVNAEEHGAASVAGQLSMTQMLQARMAAAHRRLSGDDEGRGDVDITTEEGGITTEEGGITTAEGGGVHHTAASSEGLKERFQGLRSNKRTAPTIAILDAVDEALDKEVRLLEG